MVEKQIKIAQQNLQLMRRQVSIIY